jgi:hypothetical protein
MLYDFKNIFGEFFGKKLAFLTKNKAKLCKILTITLVLRKNAKFFAENCQKSQKIVIHNIEPWFLIFVPKFSFRSAVQKMAKLKGKTG